MDKFIFGEVPYGYRLAVDRHVKLMAFAMAEVFANANYPIPVKPIDYNTLLNLKFKTFECMIKNAVEKGYAIFEDNFIANIVLVPYADSCHAPYDALVKYIREAGYPEAADDYAKTVDRIVNLEKKIKLRENTMYIEIFAVQTEIQGQGYGKRLITQVINKCKKNGWDLFLYTNTLKNESIYKHFGFETVLADGNENTGYTTFMINRAENK